MDPPPERSIAGTTAFMPRKQPVLVDLDVPLPERVVSLHQRGRLVDPGVVDQAVQAAELLGGFDSAGPIGFRGHIVPDEGRSRPELGSQRLALIVQHVADHHLRTLRYQQAGLCGTLAARSAAHEHHLVVEACHVRSPDYRQGSLADRTAWSKICLMLGDNRRAVAVPVRRTSGGGIAVDVMSAGPQPLDGNRLTRKSPLVRPDRSGY